MYSNFGKLPESVSRILETAGQAAGTTALANILVSKGMSPEEAKAAASQLIRGSGREPVIMQEESFFEKKVFGVPIVILLGIGGILTFVALSRR